MNQVRKGVAFMLGSLEVTPTMQSSSMSCDPASPLSSGLRIAPLKHLNVLMRLQILEEKFTLAFVHLGRVLHNATLSVKWSCVSSRQPSNNRLAGITEKETLCI